MDSKILGRNGIQMEHTRNENSFVDGLLKQYLLERLCISQSYLLGVDYYYVMQEIWPKTFGLSLMKNMSFVKGMLLTETEQ